MWSPQGNKVSGGSFKFMRTYSGGSTVAPDSAPITPLMSASYSDPFGEQAFQPFSSLCLDPHPSWTFSRTVSETNSTIDEKDERQPSKECFASEAKVTQLEALLEEVKGLYNAKYPLDHVGISGHELGCDVDGLAWVKYTGQGRSQFDRLQDLLHDVQDLYNAKYPLDHTDDIDREIGCDADGLLWIETTGQGIKRSQVEQLELLLEEVKGLYHAAYPLDHVDEDDRELGYDTDGLLWVRYMGQGLKTRDAKADRLQHLLDEVKGLYSGKYPLDNVDDEEFEVGTDADGLLWVKYTGDGVEERDTQMEDLEELLEEVKQLYSARYPLDHVDDPCEEIGRDVDGLLWVQYTGQGIKTQDAKFEHLETLLDDVKGLYNDRYPLDHVDDTNHEIGYDSDGLLWVKHTGESAEARELKMEELLELLEEVKGLYHEKYLLDHVDDVGYEVGYDADGLLWVQHMGLGVDRPQTKVVELQDLLQEVKNLYNEKYPRDHVDDDECEVGRDSDGLLWVRYTGHGSETREAKLDALHDLLAEVKTLYNEKFPLDHVDDVGCEMGHDADGLLWMMHTGHGLQTQSARIAQLEDLMEEVKGLYNKKYPHDHVDDIGHEVGYDADGLAWVKFTGRSQLEDLQDLLAEVKGLYNEKYPLDHVDDVDREIGFDFDGLAWTKYTGQGIERSQAERLEDLLQEVKGLYNKRYPEDSVHDAGHEVGYDADGMLWVSCIGQGVERSEVERIEDLLAEVKGLYNERYPHDHVEDLEIEIGTDVDGLLWVQHTGQGPKTWDAKVERLEDLLEEVKDLYNASYPQDHVDDEDREVGTDTDGLLWVRYTGHAAETREEQIEKLDGLLREVQSLYNERYPLDQVNDVEREVGLDADGLLWVRYTGHSGETREKEIDELQALLAEVKVLYSKKYPLDHVDEIEHEVSIDADGLLWVSHTGQGIEPQEHKAEYLDDLLAEVRGLYNEKYPLDHVDDEDAEVGHDSDGLLWVRYTGNGGRSVKHLEQLEDLLEEVQRLYSEKYPLDYLEDAGREIGYDTDGLLWIEHSGLGFEGTDTLEAEEEHNSVRDKTALEKLQAMLSEVRRLYNEKYPLDSVDDLGSEAGYDIDGLMWVSYTGLGLATTMDVAA